MRENIVKVTSSFLVAVFIKDGPKTNRIEINDFYNLGCQLCIFTFILK